MNKPQLRRKFGMGVAFLSSLFIVTFGIVGLAGVAASASAPAITHTVQDPAPHGDNGTTIDPLQYNCGNDAPTCGQVGESNGYYNGTNVDLLYSENYYCDANVSSAATSGCEVGAGPSATPSGTSAGNSGTSLGNTTHGDTLYIPVPLFANPPANPVHGDCDLYRPPADHRLLTHRGRRFPGARRRAACRTSRFPPTTMWWAPATRAARMVERRGRRHNRSGDVQHPDQRHAPSMLRSRPGRLSPPRPTPSCSSRCSPERCLPQWLRT